MPGRTRIPETISEFDAYINRTAKYLASGTPITNRERLGLSAQNGTDWNDKQVYWRDSLFPKYANPLTSTSAVKENVRQFMRDFKKFGNPLLNIMAASPNAAIADELEFRFKAKRSAATRTETAMRETVALDVKYLGGGRLHFICTAGNQSGRPGKIAGSDSVQMAWLITELHSLKSKTGVGLEMPSPEDPGMTNEIFTKASFMKSFGIANITKVAVVYQRWYNTKHPHLAGPWNAGRMLVIA